MGKQALGEEAEDLAHRLAEAWNRVASLTPGKGTHVNVFAVQWTWKVGRMQLQCLFVILHCSTAGLRVLWSASAVMTYV